jgi:hypothetical protein
MAPHDFGVVEYPHRQRSRFDQNSRRLLGRITSPQSDLFLPISSYMGIVTQVNGTFQPLRPQGCPLRFHALNRETSLLKHTFGPSSCNISTQTTSLMIYFELLPQSSMPWVPMLGKSRDTPNQLSPVVV